MFWLQFTSYESAMLVYVEGEAFVFGTPHFTGMVDQVMESIGFSADEDADFG